MTSFKTIFPAVFSLRKKIYSLAYIFVTETNINIFFLSHALHNVKMALILQSYM